MARRLLPLVALISPAIAAAQTSPPLKAPTPAEQPTQTKQLSDTLHKLLLANLPDPIVRTEHNWDHQREVFDGLKWERKGIMRFRPHVVKEMKNDGRWERVTVQAHDATKTLKLTTSNLRTDDQGNTLFDAVVQTDVKLKYENQLWAMGARLYAGETRAKCTTGVTMTVEVSSRTEFAPGATLPTVVLRVRVTEAKLSYWDLVCEHTLGVGGDAAKVIGNAVYDVMKKLKPDMEKGLLEKANAAIVKAADTKEVRVELGKLLSGKK
ncbi:MAG: hypothetical protein MUF18_22055 [Fimbriiglobus sp.]|jgi:hypothetical protein|nr:hypothetical protein [Fimbriiglobus sp.]